MHFSSKLNSKVQTIFENKFPQLEEIESRTRSFSTRLVVYFLDKMAIQSQHPGQHQRSKHLYRYGSLKRRK